MTSKSQLLPESPDFTSGSFGVFRGLSTSAYSSHTQPLPESPDLTSGSFNFSLLQPHSATSRIPRLHVGGLSTSAYSSRTQPLPESPDFTSGVLQLQPTPAALSHFQNPPTSRRGSFNFSLLQPHSAFLYLPTRFRYLRLMPTPTFTSLEAAYQLHFYLCFKTHSSRPLFTSSAVQQTLTEVTAEVCNRNDYHLLETQVSPDHLRLLISLKPQHTVSGVVRMLKGNLSRELIRRSFGTSIQLARSYFARSSGKVDIQTVRDYVGRQVSHHGYRGKWTEALAYENSAFSSPAFELKHCVSILNYHLVFATQNRTPIFDDTIAPNLFDCIIAVGRKHGFALETVSILPDHMHLLLEARPDISIGDVALTIANNSAHWMGKRYWGVLKETQAREVWQPSYYAGTVGDYTTAEVKRFLQNRLD